MIHLKRAQWYRRKGRTLGVKQKPAARSAARVPFRRPTPSPMWTREGVFAYPPPIAWGPLKGQAAVEAWRRAVSKRRFRDPLGLYIHIPPEVHYVCDFFPARETHPYIESLEREVEFLKLPKDLPVRTLYIGGSGAGAFGNFTAPQIGRLLGWLRKRFNLAAVTQSVVEVDAAELDGAKVRHLVRHGVNRISARLPANDGTAAAVLRRRLFAEGIAMCRKMGVKNIAIDVVAGRTGEASSGLEKDLKFVRSLGPSCFFLCDYSTSGDRMAERRVRHMWESATKGPIDPGSEGDNNLQLVYSNRFNASYLGLGWGAISHIRGSLVYGKAGSCFVYVDSLLRGKPPRLAGATVDEVGEMRSHIIHCLEDLGEITCSAFHAAFARDPEEAFPREFAALKASKRLVRGGDKIYLANPQEDQRYLCSVRFYGPDILRILSRRSGGGVPLVQTYGGVGGGIMDPDTYVPCVGSREHLRKLNEDGMKSLKAGNAARAARCFDAALKINPRDLSAMLNRAAAAVSRGDLDAAKRLYDQAIAAIPGGADAIADALSSRAFVNKRMGKVREAVLDLRKALRSAPKSWPRREEVRKVLDQFLAKRPLGRS
ncbi:MAG: hypothetical protein WC728_11855 [Elusimicrobiota bacterium]